MALDRRAEAEMDKAKGAVKEAAGKASGDHSLEAKGKLDQIKGGLKQDWEDTKDAVRH